MKILFCIKYLNIGGGGAERVLAEISSGLAKRKYEISALTFDIPGGNSFYNLDPQIKRIELGSKRDERLNFVTRNLKRIFELRSVIRKEKPDIVIGFMHSMFLLLGISLLGTKIPIIASEHIVPEHYKNKPFQKFLLYISPFLVKKFTSVSTQALNQYPFFIKNKMIVIPNPITLKLTGKANVLENREGKMKLLSVGRLDTQKNFITLIKAFGKIANKFPNWILHILGNGPLKNDLQNEIYKLNLESRIFLIDFTKNIEKEYLSSNLYVSASSYESFGLATAEALMHGLPAIGFDNCLGTNQLILHNKNGLLVDGEKNSIQNLASTLEQLIENDKLRLELSNFSNNIFNQNKIEYILNHWEQLFRSI